MMREYETTYIIDPSVSEKVVPEIIEKYAKYVNDSGGHIENIKEWGLRKLAYEIDGKGEGYYITMRFHSEPEVARELRRQFRLADDVMRGIIVRYN
ncbi:MAG: 30S ribosomal protein S6 [Candidatus Eremiobacteraeota bacterium]|nr:30S ribosomal protein S6 [Candidatus Eremiobacteraeota bacterium]